MKIYSENTLKNWSKAELIEHILCLQHNLQNEEIAKLKMQMGMENAAWQALLKLRNEEIEELKTQLKALEDRIKAN